MTRSFAMPVAETMRSQRSIRRYTQEEVDLQLVLGCIDLALRAPTAYNAQNWEFVVVTDTDLKRQLGRQYSLAWKLYGPIGRLLGSRSVTTKRIVGSVDWQVKNFESVPVVVVACLRGLKIPPWIPAPSFMVSAQYGSIYPSVQNLLLAAVTEGLGASLLTLPLWRPSRIRKALKMPRTVQPCCLITMGWPAEPYGPTTRKHLDDVVYLNHHGTPLNAGADGS